MVHTPESLSQSSTSNIDGSLTMERTKKRVEWSRNLTSVDSFTAPDDRSPMWDSETDHMLSYFLGDSGHGNGMTSPPTQFATISGMSHVATMSTINNGPPSSHPSLGVHHHAANGILHHPTIMPGLGGERVSVSDDAEGDLNFDEDPVPPPTPATQYYHYSKPKANNTSNSHIMNMKSTSSQGGHASEHPLESMSPISPTAMIGVGHEPLMLPPSPDGHPTTINNNNNTTQQSTTSSNTRQSHIEWLKQINALAKQASNVTVVTQPPAPGMPMPPPAIANMPPLPPGFIPTAHSMFYTQAALNQIQQQPQETEEKRARRLERNRESARKSRRRKKERLSHLEEKVLGLHTEIEKERRKQVNEMNHQLIGLRQERIIALKTSGPEETEAERSSVLRSVLQGTGPNCPVQRDVIDFQYSALKQAILPRYQKFLLWLTLHPEQYFSAGKENHVRREGKQALRVSTGKISSKQVGDELMNGRKLDDGTVEPPPEGEKGNQIAQAFDSFRMWPLFCFELSVSVDQEERFMQAHKRICQSESLQRDRSQIDAATRMTSRLKEAVLLQSHNASVRSERNYLEILTPDQAAKYLQWVSSNRERCRDVSNRRRQNREAMSPTSIEKANLLDVCHKLEEVLKISKGQY